jgi:thiamine biosynthesis lipoprotein
MKRRRAITILGASSLAGLNSCQRPDPQQTFSTICFGTEVHFRLHGITDSIFKTLSAACFSRLREIESLFSVYDPASAISSLNREGQLKNPPAEFLDLLETSLTFGEKTNGIFDISVQPLWDWRMKWKSADLDQRAAMESTTWEATLALVDYRGVTASRSAISFAKPGMAITLNGIVQGHATDQIQSLLKNAGVKHTLVNIGEYAALGNAPDGDPWKVELAASGEVIPLVSGRALAVSAGSGYTFDPEGRIHHIFRPSDGANARPDSSIVVTAPTATTADALATTLAVATEIERRAILGKFPEVKFLLVGDQGRVDIGGAGAAHASCSVG